MEQRAISEHGAQPSARQDLADARQDVAEERLSRTEVTLGDIYHTFTITMNQIDGRMGRIETSMDKLSNSSNHRMETFELWVAKFSEALALKADSKVVNLALGGKADKDELVTSFVVRLLRHAWFRVVMGAIGMAVITEASTQHLFISAAQWFESLF